MNPNPYAPPESPVTDTPEATVPAQKPPQIGKAVLLLWTTLGLGVVNSALQWQFLTSTSSVEMVLSIQLITFAILAWLTIKISRGRNWARITYLVLMIIGLPAAFIQIPAMFARSPISVSISVVQLLLQIGALYLIFSEPGRRWFKRATAGKATIA